MNVLILGGTSEIGKELARKFIFHGHEVYMAARKVSRLEPLRKDMFLKSQRNINLIEMPTEQVHARHFLSEFEVSMDVVVCLLGYLGDQKKAELDQAELNNIIDNNYRIPVSILTNFARAFESRKSGTIIGFSSVAGERGRQSNFYYGSAKAAFTTYLDGLRNKLSKTGVHVMTVKPGFMKTKMTAHLKLPALLTATPPQVANSIYNAFLKKKNKVYVAPVWRYIMWMIRTIPEPIFKNLKL